MTRESIRANIIKLSVANLREFGYPKCDAENILTDPLYRAFLKGMVEGTLLEAPSAGPIAKACRALLKEIDPDPPVSASPEEP